ncbi:hypothetical protein FN846DRAFT_995466 [Sphaerosporella brunnea]|uniref:Uncharacterized protein n=1 Tax=Sphaerosporella brunnea TaxID=1250544 RepID=A0A5J5EM98_9PEZI|nr:hypothetical protein FN846DRAFT_995466 [Sphaerosporella brunnea]
MWVREEGVAGFLPTLWRLMGSGRGLMSTNTVVVVSGQERISTGQLYGSSNPNLQLQQVAETNSQERSLSSNRQIEKVSPTRIFLVPNACPEYMYTSVQKVRHIECEFVYELETNVKASHGKIRSSVCQWASDTAVTVGAVLPHCLYASGAKSSPAAPLTGSGINELRWISIASRIPGPEEMCWNAASVEALTRSAPQTDRIITLGSKSWLRPGRWLDLDTSCSWQGVMLRAVILSRETAITYR